MWSGTFGAPPMDARDASEVHLWWFRTDVQVGEGQHALLDAGERAAAQRFRRAVDAEAFVARRAARRGILSRYVERDAAALTFDVRCVHCGGMHGKPRLRAEAGSASVLFNASHAAGVGTVAVSPREVGVDVESPRRVEDDDAIADRFFAPAERAMLASVPEEARAEAFLRVWSAKEAYLKLRGLGLAAPLERIDTTAWGADAPAADPLEDAAALFWLLRPTLPAQDGWSVSLAVAGPEPRPRVRVLRWPEDAPRAGFTRAPSSG